MMNTSSKGILLWFAHIVGYLNSSTVISDVSIQIQIGSFIEAMRQGSRCRSAEIIVDVGITRVTLLTAFSKASTRSLTQSLPALPSRAPPSYDADSG